MVKLVADLATYEAAVAAGKTSPDVIYLILAEKKVFFQGEDWTQGGGGGGDTEELEEVAAAGLVDLKAVQLKHDSELSRCTRNADFNNKVGEIDKNIIDNEELIAHALVNLNKGLQECKELIKSLKK